MEQSTDNDIRISPLTIIQNRYGGGFLAFNLESWDVPKEINDDGLDFISFWHHDAQKYIIGKGDTPQEAMDNLKAKLNPAPDNPLIDKFLFLDFEGIANLGDEDFVVHNGDKIAQMVLTSYAKILRFAKVDGLDKLPPSDRMTAGFGSTGV